MYKKNKIALVVYNLKKGGLERVVSNQTFMFSNLGFEVDLFVLENEIYYSFKANLKVYDLKETDNLLTRFLKYRKLRNNLLKENYDYVIDHRYRLNDFMETVWLKYIYRNRDLIYIIHNSTLDRYINLKTASAQNIQFVSVSKGIETKVNECFSKAKIKTIYNVVELEKKSSSFDEINDKYILAVGRMAANNVKQLDILIDCYSKSNLPNQNIKLLILGSGPLMNTLKKQVADLKLEKLVVFKGIQNDLFSYYHNAQYLVLSSKHEGLPTVLIECLFCGTPVISYDCEFGPSEIIQDKINGLLVENQNTEQLIDAMNLLIEDVSLYNICKQNTVNSALKFSEQSISEEWMIFFNDKH